MALAAPKEKHALFSGWSPAKVPSTPGPAALSHRYYKYHAPHLEKAPGQTVSSASTRVRLWLPRALVQPWPHVNCSQPQESMSKISLSHSSFMSYGNIYGVVRCKASKTWGRKRDKNAAFGTLLSPPRLTGSRITMARARPVFIIRPHIQSPPFTAPFPAHFIIRPHNDPGKQASCPLVGQGQRLRKATTMQ